MTQEALRMAHKALIGLSIKHGEMTDEGMDAIAAIKEALAKEKTLQALHSENERLGLYKDAYAEQEQEPVSKYCCHLCFNKSGLLLLDRMILCSECGNKRCPKATNHALQCTNSNEPNQAGSVFTTPPQRTWVGLTDGETAECFETKVISDRLKADAKRIEAKIKEKNT